MKFSHSFALASMFVTLMSLAACKSRSDGSTALKGEDNFLTSEGSISPLPFNHAQGKGGKCDVGDRSMTGEYKIPDAQTPLSTVEVSINSGGSLHKATYKLIEAARSSQYREGEIHFIGTLTTGDSFFSSQSLNFVNGWVPLSEAMNGGGDFGLGTSKYGETTICFVLLTADHK